MLTSVVTNDYRIHRLDLTSETIDFIVGYEQINPTYCGTRQSGARTVEIDSLSRTTALVGSLFFLASDTTLSLHLFRTSVPYANIIIMVTYYIGQLLIAMSTKDPYHEGEEDLTNYYRETASPLLA